MKKRYMALMMIIFAALIFIPSCSSFGGNGDETLDMPSAVETGEGGAPADTGEKEEEVVNYGFTVFPDGNYLADKKFDTDESLPDYDVKNVFAQSLEYYYYGGVCSTEDTVYYAKEDVAKSGRVCVYFMYYDKATGTGGKLCGKPECTHDDENCDAFFDGNIKALSLQIYDGKLYWHYGGTIYRENLDGGEREKVASLSYNDYTWGVMIHRGYAYSWLSQQVVNGGKVDLEMNISAVKLGEDECFTVFEKTFEDALGENLKIRFIGNDMYVLVSYSKGKDTPLELYKWDTKTRKAEEIYSCERDEFGAMFMWVGLGGDFCAVPGDGIYIPKWKYEYREDPETGETIPYQQHGICKYSFATGKMEELGWDKKYRHPFFSEERVYFTNGSVYDLQLNELFKNEIPEDISVQGFAGADSDYMYLYAEKEAGSGYYIAVPYDGWNVIRLE